MNETKRIQKPCERNGDGGIVRVSSMIQQSAMMFEWHLSSFEFGVMRSGCIRYSVLVMVYKIVRLVYRECTWQNLRISSNQSLWTGQFTVRDTVRMENFDKLCGQFKCVFSFNNNDS